MPRRIVGFDTYGTIVETIAEGDGSFVYRAAIRNLMTSPPFLLPSTMATCDAGGGMTVSLTRTLLAASFPALMFPSMEKSE